MCGMSILLGNKPRFHTVKEGKATGRLFVLIGGFGQPIESWRTFCQALNDEDQVITLSRRLLENNLWTILPVSWAPTIIQKWVMAGYLHNLLSNPNCPRKVTLVAHSAGGLLADYLAGEFPNRVGAVILLNSYPVGQRGALLTNGTFWREGGLRAVPTAVLALLMFWRGMKPNKAVSNSLFASNQLSEEENRANHEALVPDSVGQFLGMTLWLKGTRMLALRRKGHKIPTSVIYSHIDPIFRPEDQRAMARRLDARLFSWHERTPHCWWLNNEPEVLEHNLNILRQALYPELATVADTESADIHVQEYTLH